MKESLGKLCHQAKGIVWETAYWSLKTTKVLSGRQCGAEWWTDRETSETEWKISETFTSIYGNVVSNKVAFRIMRGKMDF